MVENSDFQSNEWLYIQRLSMETNITTRGTSICQKLQRYFKNNVRPRLTRRFFFIIIFGQFTSLLLCAAGVSSQKLVIACHVKIPAFQAFCNYALLATVFAPQLMCRGEEAKKIVKERWWKYIILAMIDVEANFAVYTAYQYTSLTSVQLLDCLSIPVVVLLSIVVLKAKYNPVHFFGVFICVAGMGFLIWADITGSRKQGPKPGDHHSEMVGDLLVIGGAVFYAASNIAEEFVVKTSTIAEFLGIMTFFACFFSGANVIIFERDDLSSIVWNYEILLYLALNVFSMFTFYALVPVLIKYSSATLLNLTLLTADLYSLFAGLYLFNYTFSNLYILSFVAIVVGVVIFKVFPTPSRVDECETEIVVNDDVESEESLLIPGT